MNAIEAPSRETLPRLGAVIAAGQPDAATRVADPLVGLGGRFRYPEEEIAARLFPDPDLAAEPKLEPRPEAPPPAPPGGLDRPVTAVVVGIVVSLSLSAAAVLLFALSAS